MWYSEVIWRQEERGCFQDGATDGHERAHIPSVRGYTQSRISVRLTRTGKTSGRLFKIDWSKINTLKDFKNAKNEIHKIY